MDTRHLHALATNASAIGDVATLYTLLGRAPQLLHATQQVKQPIMRTAAANNQMAVLAMLLAQGADVDVRDSLGWTPLMVAVRFDHDDLVKLLCSYGASRTAQSALGCTAADYAAAYGNHELHAWLKETLHWTPLHHVELLTPARARALLRAGADLQHGSPSPLERAQAIGGEAAKLVVLAAQPWSAQTHGLFSEAARAHARAVLLLAYQLGKQPQYAMQAQALVDIWVHHLLPIAVSR